MFIKCTHTGPPAILAPSGCEGSRSCLGAGFEKNMGHDDTITKTFMIYEKESCTQR